MNNYNPYTLPRLTRQVFTREIESASQPGSALKISFRAMDAPDTGLMTDRWTEAERQYIVQPGEKEPAQEFPGLDAEEAARISTSILQNAASMEVMQPGPERHALEFFVYIAFRDEDMWDQLSKFALEVNQGKAESPEDLIATRDSSQESASPDIVTQS